MSSAREEILARIRAALQKPDEYPVAEPNWEAVLYNEPEVTDWVIRFAEVFESRGGKFHFVEEPAAFLPFARAFAKENGWQHIACYDATIQTWLKEAGVAYDATDKHLHDAQVSFTLAEALVARTGSVLTSSALGGGRRLTIYPPVHVVVAFASQIVPDIGEGLAYLQQLHPDGLPSLLTLVTGPSRTADIEKTLVLGAHGPKELHVVLIDDSVHQG